MGKNLDICILLDFYGDMLTEKQRDVLDLYYNDDLSLAEIGDDAGISRQGVRDSIKRGEATLLEMEDRLGFLKIYRKNERIASEIKELAQDIIMINNRQNSVGLIDLKAKEIISKTEIIEKD